MWPAPVLWTGDNPAKRLIERIAHRDDKPHKSGAATCRQQRQQESHSEQSVNNIEDVIDDLGNSRQPARAFYFALSVNDLINSFRAKLTGDLINSLRFARRSLSLRRVRRFRPELRLQLDSLPTRVVLPVLLLPLLTCRRSSDFQLPIANCQLKTSLSSGANRNRQSAIGNVLAERVGFEPTERFPVHSISSAASSTTPAPLRRKSRCEFASARF